jgi:hypothetical protein
LEEKLIMHGLLRLFGVGVLGLALVAAVACGDDDEPSAAGEEALANLCADLEELEAALAEFIALPADSTLADVEAARDEIGDGIDQVAESAAGVDEADLDELNASFETLDGNVDALVDDAVAAELSSLQSDAQEVFTARDAVFGAVDCAALEN